MAIDRPNGSRDNGASGVTSDPFDTRLIARLFQEVYSELQPHVPKTPPSGLGAASPTRASNGATPTPNAPPSVHPNVGGSRTLPPLGGLGPSIIEEKSRSGGYMPDGLDNLVLGEQDETTRIYADSIEKIDSPAAAGSYGRHTDTDRIPVIAHDDAFASPQLYFLRHHEAQGVAPEHSESARPLYYTPRRGFDVEAIRADFPALHQAVHGKPLIWFDNAATTHKPRSVIEATSQFYARDYSNVNRAAHALAQRATELYEGTREKVREFIGARSKDEIVFVRGTTEAINLVAQTFGKANVGPGDEILLTTMEHHANIVPWKHLSEQTGANLRVAPINDRGELLLDQFATLLSERTKLVAITHVSNALGTINPVEHIIALAHAYGVPVLVDGAQSTPHLPVNVQAMGADFFVFSGHKIFAPTGIGILYGRQELLQAMPPYQGGGSMIADVTFSKISYNPPPQKFEAGTQDIAGVVGLGAAIDYLLGIGLPAIAAYEHELLEYATALLAEVRGVRLIGTAAAKASVLSFVLPGIDSEEIGHYLDSHGIAVRAGHHCAQPSLRRFGVEKAVRPSFAFYNTREEIDVLIRALHALPRR